MTKKVDTSHKILSEVFAPDDYRRHLGLEYKIPNLWWLVDDVINAKSDWNHPLQKYWGDVSYKDASTVNEKDDIVLLLNDVLSE
jgi:hypothetical protein